MSLEDSFLPGRQGCPYFDIFADIIAVIDISMV